MQTNLKAVGGTWPTGEYRDPALFDLYREGEVVAGKYRLKRVLGAGGMGTVWLATNTLLEVDVAIKLLHADFEGQHEASQRFLHEARATAKLRHPSIVGLHDFGHTRHGHAFMVMEHLQGESLGDMLDRRVKIAPIEAVQLLLQVLDALDFAHGHGVVHRDLKPDNILVVGEGDAYACKVVDFGIAKVNERDALPALNQDSVESVAQRSASRLTQHGALLGSPEYMAPEQARGETDVDRRADIWGLTVCLYECIHGERPFSDERLDQLLLSVLIKEPPPPSDVDDGLWQIMRRGLEKNRDHRWQFASELGEALARWLIQNGVEVDASGRSLRSRWLGESSIADHSQPLRAMTVNQAGAMVPPVIPVAPKKNTALWLATAIALIAVVSLGGVFLLSSPENAASRDLAGEAAEADVQKAAAPTHSAAPPATETATPAPAEGAPSAAASTPERADTPPVFPGTHPRATPLTKSRGGKGGLPLPEDADF